MQYVTLLVLALVALCYSQSCPSGTCASSETCCSLGNGQWGCCPYPNADCCTDHAHCCPNGYACDLSQGKCIKQQSGHLYHLMKLESLKLKDDCPAGTCASSETCCSLGNGQWGCCPYANADCCTDHAHCCPNGYTCDLSQGKCVQGSANRFEALKLATLKVQDDCPAGTCASSETCCSLGNGQWGCCPYANADCCTDHAHCCPNGYTCDLSQGKCVQGKRGLAISLVQLE